MVRTTLPEFRDFSKKVGFGRNLDDKIWKNKPVWKFSESPNEFYYYQIDTYIWERIQFTIMQEINTIYTNFDCTTRKRYCIYLQKLIEQYSLTKENLNKTQSSLLMDGISKTVDNILVNSLRCIIQNFHIKVLLNGGLSYDWFDNKLKDYAVELWNKTHNDNYNIYLKKREELQQTYIGEVKVLYTGSSTSSTTGNSTSSTTDTTSSSIPTIYKVHYYATVRKMERNNVYIS